MNECIASVCRYMYKGYADSCAARGQFWIRKTLLDLYKPTADMFPGRPPIHTYIYTSLLAINSVICTCMYHIMPIYSHSRFNFSKYILYDEELYVCMYVCMYVCPR